MYGPPEVMLHFHSVEETVAVPVVTFKIVPFVAGGMVCVAVGAIEVEEVNTCAVTSSLLVDSQPDTV